MLTREEIVRAEAGSHVVRRERTVRAVVFIFLLNLLGFWFLLPGLFLLLGSFLDDLLRFRPLLPGLTPLWYSLAAVLLPSGLSLSLYSILLLAYFGDGAPIASLPPKKFVDKGPYICCRHPIYLGYTISLLGAGFWFGSLSFLLVVLPTFFLGWILYAVLYEERALMRRYGGRYEKYRSSTPLLFSFTSVGVKANRVKHPLMYMLTSVAFKVYNKILLDVEIIGDPEPPIQSPFVIVSNHASYLDPLIINAYVKEYARISTTEKAYRNILLRKYLASVGAYSLARYKPHGFSSVRDTIRILKDNTSIAFFPEGERSWDGKPLEISDGAVKLLQKTGLPILAVNVSGNYNIFPRWASWPRRGKIRLHFHPPFCLDKDKTIEQNKNLLSEKLHAPGRSLDDAVNVKGKNIAKGLPLLLWRCPLCKTNDSLVVERGSFLRCRCCDRRWRLATNYDLTLLSDTNGQSNDDRKALSDWYASIKDLNEVVPLEATFRFTLPGETPLLESKQVEYSAFINLKRIFSHKGTIVLTDQRLVFFNKNQLLFDELSDIRKLVIEGNRCLELGFTDKMISIRFKDESPLKWQTYLCGAKSLLSPSH